MPKRLLAMIAERLTAETKATMRSFDINQQVHDADLLQAGIHFEGSKLPKYLTTLTLFRGRKWAAPTWISFFAALTFDHWQVSPD